MANTAGGLPYPVGTDFVVDGDNAMRALAEASDARTLYGGYTRVHTVASVGGWSAAWVSIPYDAALVGAKPAVPPGFRYDATKRAFIIQVAGIYLMQMAASGSAGTFAIRIRAAGRTLASATATADSWSSATSAFGYLDVGAEVAGQFFQLAGSLTTPADAPDTPNFLTITHLPIIK